MIGELIERFGICKKISQTDDNIIKRGLIFSPFCVIIRSNSCVRNYLKHRGSRIMLIDL